MPKGMAVTRMTPRYLKPAKTEPMAGSGYSKPKPAIEFHSEVPVRPP